MEAQNEQSEMTCWDTSSGDSKEPAEQITYLSPACAQQADCLVCSADSLGCEVSGLQRDVSTLVLPLKGAHPLHWKRPVPHGVHNPIDSRRFLQHKELLACRPNAEHDGHRPPTFDSRSDRYSRATGATSFFLFLIFSARSTHLAASLLHWVRDAACTAVAPRCKNCSAAFTYSLNALSNSPEISAFVAAVYKVFA